MTNTVFYLKFPGTNYFQHKSQKSDLELVKVNI